MNGYSIFIESYKKLMDEGKISKEEAEKEIRIYEFFNACDMDDFCSMVDTGAFNDIIRSYLCMAVNNSGIDEKSKDKVKSQIRFIFDEVQAKYVLEKYSREI